MIESLRRALLLWTIAMAGTAAFAGTTCPAGTGATGFYHNPDNAATGCNVIITIAANNTVSTVVKDPLPYDTSPANQSDDTLVGVQNNSATPITSIILSGTGIFDLERDGLCNYSFVGDGYCLTNAPGGKSSTGTIGAGLVNNGNGVDPYDYYGLTSSFSGLSSCPSQSTANCTGTVNFNPPIPPGGSTYFSLEGIPSASLQVVVGGPPPPTTPAPPSLLLSLAGLGCLGIYLAYRKFAAAN